MTNTIHNVPRDLLERVLYLMDNYIGTTHPEEDEIRAILSAPSPAGVDGLEVVSNWVLFDAEADKPYIKKMLPEGFLAFFDCEEDARRAKANNPRTDYKRIDRVKAEDAKAIIDGLRGEVGAQRVKTCAALKERNDAREERDQHAQRIGELEGLLRAESARVDFLDAYIVTADAPDTGKAAMLADSGTLRECIDAALSAGKDSDQ